jgi:hypothetical protein
MKNILLVLLIGGCGELPGEGSKAAPAVVTAPQQSGSRLKVIWNVGSDGSRFGTGKFQDSKLGAACAPATIAAKVTCAPFSDVASPTAFSDAQCSQGVALGAPSTRFVQALDGSFYVATPYTGGLFHSVDGVCSVYTPGDATAFQNGALLDLVVFSEEE